MKAIVSEKGQVTIPKALRERLGIQPGQVLDFEEQRGRLVAQKVEVSSFRAVVDKYYGALKHQLGGRSSDELIEELRGPGPQ